MTVLILGGTAEARELARDLAERRVPAMSSLAGRVSRPALPAGEVRVGGFGGVAGLVDFLQRHPVTAVVDATHPFAAQMSRHAAAAAAATGVPLLRLARPGWADHPTASSWEWVPDLPAAAVAGATAARPFLTTGRQSLPHFAGWADRDVLVRLVERPATPLFPRWTVVLSRGPYDPDSERRLLGEEGVDVLVTKDSGGNHTVAKLEVATALGLRVVVVARPPAEVGVRSVSTVAEVLAWLGQ
jgi:precorrin-6A/cobalt-precorrin-6A reductase